ncbi:MAG: hypothetical protein K8F91_07930 [Candidatus Obscuribacterales bacterium]|nr:hypothetical protein [Candidatus Obscuribacterales bacterium]
MSTKHNAYPEGSTTHTKEPSELGKDVNVAATNPDHSTHGYTAPDMPRLGIRVVPVMNELLGRPEPNKAYFMVYRLDDVGDGVHVRPVLISGALIDPTMVH